MKPARRSPAEVGALVELLRACAAIGWPPPQAARAAGITRAYAHALAKRYAIAFRSVRLSTEHFREAGRRSAQSPRHYTFTSEDRERSARTRRGEASSPPPDVNARRRELVARALERLGASQARA